jgi:hypothetical protein
MAVLLGLVFSAVGAAPTQAAGPYTHGVFVREAMDIIGPFSSYGRLNAILDDNIAYVKYGAVYPDLAVPYAKINTKWEPINWEIINFDPTWANAIHEEGFIQANYIPFLSFARRYENEKISGPYLYAEAYKVYLEDDSVNSKIPPFRRALMNQFITSFEAANRGGSSKEDEKKIAFLFGLIAHQESDATWHLNASGIKGVEKAAEEKYKQNEFFLEMIVKEPNLVGWVDIDFLFEPVIRKLVLNASDAAGFARPYCHHLLCFDWFGLKDPANPIVVGNGLQALYWVVNPTPLINDEQRNLYYWVDSYEDGGIQSNSWLIAGAWMSAWDYMMAHLEDPVTTLSQAPDLPAEADGWYNQPVTVTLKANQSPTMIFYDISYNRPFPADTNWITAKKYEGPITISEEGYHSITYFALSETSEEQHKSANIKIDYTPPNITGGATAQPNASGWFTGDVTVEFAATDELSGVASLTPDQVLTADGAGQSVTGTATDRAGNSVSYTVDGINIDKTPPVITGATIPLPNANGWHNTDVTVRFTATDATSGVASVTPDQVLTTEGADQSVTGTALDLAGNSALFTVEDINIAKTAPLITIASPQAAVYMNTDRPLADWTAVDALSGVESEQATFDGNLVIKGAELDLLALAPGPKIFAVDAVDLAGNSASAEVTLMVSVDIYGLQEALERACGTGMILKPGSCGSLMAKLKSAAASYERGNWKTTANQLNAFLNELDAQAGKAVKPAAYDLLKADAEFVIASLR